MATSPTPSAPRRAPALRTRSHRAPCSTAHYTSVHNRLAIRSCVLDRIHFTNVSHWLPVAPKAAVLGDMISVSSLLPMPNTQDGTLGGGCDPWAYQPLQLQQKSHWLAICQFLTELQVELDVSVGHCAGAPCMLGCEARRVAGQRSPVSTALPLSLTCHLKCVVWLSHVPPFHAR